MLRVRKESFTVCEINRFLPSSFVAVLPLVTMFLFLFLC